MGASRFLHHEPCPSCGSKDNLARYSDGHANCFSLGCDYFERGDSQERRTTGHAQASRKAMIAEWSVIDLSSRGINEETCRKFDYGVGNYKGQKVQIANYIEHGERVSQKIRFKDKSFLWLGDSKKAGLFGKHLWEPGQKKLVITEGEIDAMSVAQAQGLKWPVVSIKNGVGGHKNDVLENLEWIESFQEVVIMFDQDDAGRQAAYDVASVITPGKAKIASLPRNDANEMLVARESKGIIDAIFGATTYKPNDIQTFAEAADDMDLEPEWGTSWPYDGLTQITYGRRRGELVFIGGGTGVGKTDHLMRIITHNALTCGERTCWASFEQGTGETVKRMAGVLKGRAFHIPDAEWTREELEEAREEIKHGDWGALINHDGPIDWDSLVPKIRYMVLGLGCRDVIIDHLTALVAEADNERQEIERIVKDMARLVQQLDCTMYVVSHLSTPEGTPHEEGGRVMVRHFKGSRAIGYWGHFILGLERNQQAQDEKERRTTTIRCLKDRLTGQGAGQYIRVRFDPETGQQIEVPNDEEPESEDYGFQDESEPDF